MTVFNHDVGAHGTDSDARLFRVFRGALKLPKNLKLIDIKALCWGYVGGLTPRNKLVFILNLS